MRLIDVDALDFTIPENPDFMIVLLMQVLKNVIDNAPTIDPESLRSQGHWIGEADGYADGELVYDVWYCSECNHCIDDGTDNPDLLPDFCPGCGAYMKGAGKNADS